MSISDEAPAELVIAVQEFWPLEEWDNALKISREESNWDAFALNNTAYKYGCGAPIGTSVDGVPISAERSVGYFQINSCNFPTWEWQRLYNARHNAGTAHLVWSTQGWRAWLFSARKLGLVD
jgi:hypothetical protein